jgi:hypothetical protein
MLRIELLAQRVQMWIDLDGVDALRALAERDRYIASRSGADDQHPAQRVVWIAFIGCEVQRLGLTTHLERFDHLMGDPVHADVVLPTGTRVGPHLVVGRPMGVR